MFKNIVWQVSCSTLNTTKSRIKEDKIEKNSYIKETNLTCSHMSIYYYTSISNNLSCVCKSLLSS